MKKIILGLEKDWIAFLFGIMAILLLFAPFEHFELHVRILGIEILAYVFIRKHNILKSKTREAE